MKPILRNLLATAAVATLPACVPLAHPGALFVSARLGPPPPRVEVIGYAPGPEFVWMSGFWDWGGSGYAWVPGHWNRRPYARAMWVPDRWQRSPRGWYREQGHWRGNGRALGRRDRDDWDDRDDR